MSAAPSKKRETSIDLPLLRGWIRLNRILHEAALHPEIMGSVGAKEFVQVAIALTARTDALFSSSVRDALEPLRKLYKQQEQSDNASQKNAAAREWVRNEWREHREAYKDNMSDFARTYKTLVVDKFGPEARVTEETIKRRWLKGI